MLYYWSRYSALAFGLRAQNNVGDKLRTMLKWNGTPFLGGEGSELSRWKLSISRVRLECAACGTQTDRKMSLAARLREISYACARKLNACTRKLFASDISLDACARNQFASDILGIVTLCERKISLWNKIQALGCAFCFLSKVLHISGQFTNKYLNSRSTQEREN